MRARERGGAWTRWTVADDGNPVYFGEADELQLRARGWQPEGTLHYVNVSGTTSAASSLLTTFRSAVNCAFVSAAGVLAPSADAAPTRPAMVTRAQWGAQLAKGGCPPRETPAYGQVKAAVVHHTVTAQTLHRRPRRRGSCSGSAATTATPTAGTTSATTPSSIASGPLYVGPRRRRSQSGDRRPRAGLQRNDDGIASIGTHTTVGVTPVELQSIATYLAWKLPRTAIPAIGKTRHRLGRRVAEPLSGRSRARLKRIIGHRDVGLTECPGNALYAQLGQLRATTQQLIDAGGGIPTPPTATVPPPTTHDSDDHRRPPDPVASRRPG